MPDAANPIVRPDDVVRVGPIITIRDHIYDHITQAGDFTSLMDELGRIIATATAPAAEELAMRKLDRDLREAAQGLKKRELRFLVDSYYAIQNTRIRTAHQVRALSESGEPNRVVEWYAGNSEMLEKMVASALKRYIDHEPLAEWLIAQKGIGPIIASGLIAHIDMNVAHTAGRIWSFAGLDPKAKWEKGKKRPWNAALKRLMFLVGESFVKVSHRDDAYYGKLYQERRAYENARNEQLMYREQAEHLLKTRQIGADKEARKLLEQGKLFPAHLHMRAKRWAVKMFLSHLHEVWHRQIFGCEPPKPYAIGIMHHDESHYRPPPGPVPTPLDPPWPLPEFPRSRRVKCQPRSDPLPTTEPLALRVFLYRTGKCGLGFPHGDG